MRRFSAGRSGASPRTARWRALALSWVLVSGCGAPPAAEPPGWTTTTVAPASPSPAIVVATTSSASVSVGPATPGVAASPAASAPSVKPSPSPSPTAEGSVLAFERGGAIWVAGADGQGARQVVGGGDLSEPCWSPDGRQILYTRGRGMAAELYLVAAAGGSTRRLTSNARPESGATWSPDGSRIAYTLPRVLGPGGSLDPAAPEEAWVVEPGSGREWKAADGFDPAWSPDGRRLAYATNGRRRAEAPAGPDRNAIHIVEADGANDRPILAVDQMPTDLEPRYNFPFRPGTFRLRAPNWSPDGRTLAASADGHTALAVTFDEGGQDVKVHALAYEGGVGRAVWSPRRDPLAVEQQPATRVDVVLLVDLATGGEVRLGGIQAGLQAATPAWAPDGRRLALVASGPADRGGSSSPRDLRVYATDGAALGAVASGPLANPDWRR